MEIMISGKTRKYRITSDDRQFILSEQKKRGQESKTPGETYFVEIGYFAKVDGIIERLMMLALNEMDITTLHELLNEMRSTREWLKETFNGKAAA